MTENWRAVSSVAAFSSFRTPIPVGLIMGSAPLYTFFLGHDFPGSNDSHPSQEIRILLLRFCGRTENRESFHQIFYPKKQSFYSVGSFFLLCPLWMPKKRNSSRLKLWDRFPVNVSRATTVSHYCGESWREMVQWCLRDKKDANKVWGATLLLGVNDD